jgi:hypothetical protein
VGHHITDITQTARAGKIQWFASSISGKKVNLQEFDEIQNSVLKCLGLLSA